MQPLGESWDVVEVVRSLVTEVDSLQKIVAGRGAAAGAGRWAAAVDSGGDVGRGRSGGTARRARPRRGKQQRGREAKGEGRNEVSHSFAQLRRPFPLFVAEVGMEILIRDARFWVALLLLIRSVLFYVVPAFPEQIWVAIDTFVGVVLGILAGNNVVQTRRAAQRGRGPVGRRVAGLRRGTVGRVFLLRVGTCRVRLGVPQPSSPSHSTGRGMIPSLQR